MSNAGVKSFKTFEEAQTQVRDYLAKHQVSNHTYAFVFGKDDQFNVHMYNGRPCYGEMRMYNKTHPGQVQDSVNMPGDLNQAFPDGTPLAVGIAMNIADKKKSDMLDFMYSADSPYRSVFHHVEKTYTKGGLLKDIFLWYSDFDPSVLVHALIAGRRYMPGNTFDAYREKYGPLVALFLEEALTKQYGGALVGQNGYIQHGGIEFSRWFNGEPYNISVNAKTLHDRAVYNRPDLAFIWGPKAAGAHEDNLGGVFPGFFAGQAKGLTYEAVAEVLLAYQIEDILSLLNPNPL